jgi:hypothetical protein
MNLVLRPGTSTVISAVHGVGGPGRVWLGSVERDCNRNLVCAAAGPTFVLVSVVGAADHPMAPFRPKHAAAQHLVLPRRQPVARDRAIGALASQWQ